jgi:hypothetical protein
MIHCNCGKSYVDVKSLDWYNGGNNNRGFCRSCGKLLQVTPKARRVEMFPAAEPVRVSTIERRLSL